MSKRIFELKIGEKPREVYVLEIIRFTNKYGKIKVKARGKYISKAIICSDLACRKTNDNLIIKDGIAKVYREIVYNEEEHKNYTLTAIELTIEKMGI